MKNLKIIKILFISLIISFSCQSVSDQKHSYNEILGRWDLTVQDPEGLFPSWLEITEVNNKLDGRLVGQGGHARPLLYIHFDGNELQFSSAPQYERRTDDLMFIAQVKDRRIEGKTVNDKGEIILFEGVPAPELPYRKSIQWNDPIPLLTGNDLSQWKVRKSEAPNGWTFKDGILTNTPPSVDLLTKQKFSDFKLHVEFNMPKEVYSNSGVYLRGRYEIQIAKPRDMQPHSRKCGGVYGFITPTEMPVKPDGEWNTYDITLIGRKVTLIFNGEKVIDNQEIPGITGGALDSHEVEPGPILLQGDHAAIQYRNITITPAK